MRDRWSRALVVVAVLGAALLLAGCAGTSVVEKASESAVQKAVLKVDVRDAAERAAARELRVTNETEPAIEREITSGAYADVANAPRVGGESAAAYVESSPTAEQASEEVVSQAAQIDDAYVARGARRQVRACASGATLSVAKALALQQLRGQQYDLDATYYSAMVTCLHKAFPDSADDIKLVATLYHASLTQQAQAESASASPEQYQLWYVYTSDQLDADSF
jgi:hypothetical protein